jgi:hypothetical protein
MFRRCVQCWVCFPAGQLQEPLKEAQAVGNMLYGMQGEQ